MKAYTAAATATILLSTISSTTAFAPSATPFLSKYTETRRFIQPSSTLQMAVSAPDITVRDEINAMHIKDIRKELESYGIDNKSFFEKKELVDALLKARQEEVIPNYEKYEATIGSTDTTTSTFADTSFANTKTASSSKKDKNWFQTLKDNVTEGVKGVARSERIKLEMAKLKDVKVKELKNELESYGFSTKSYFEKSEFERAVAEARVDGVTKKYSSSAASGSDPSSSSRGNRATSSTNNEDWDPSYKNVFVKRFDASTIDPRGVIDIRAR